MLYRPDPVVDLPRCRPNELGLDSHVLFLPLGGLGICARKVRFAYKSCKQHFSPGTSQNDRCKTALVAIGTFAVRSTSVISSKGSSATPLKWASVKTSDCFNWFRFYLICGKSSTGNFVSFRILIPSLVR